MAKKLHEGGPPYPRGEMGFKDFGATSEEPGPSGRHRGARTESVAKHRKEGHGSKKKHPKRV